MLNLVPASSVTPQALSSSPSVNKATASRGTRTRRRFRRLDELCIESLSNRILRVSRVSGRADGKVHRLHWEVEVGASKCEPAEPRNCRHGRVRPTQEVIGCQKKTPQPPRP